VADHSDPISAATAHELASRRDAAVRAHQAGDSDSARADYDWVLEHEPGHASTLYLRAILDRDQGRIDNALAGLRAAIDAAPGFDDARTALANLLLDRGDAQGAAATASEGIACVPRSATLWRALGLARLKLRDAMSAVAAFAESLAREPTHGETHYNHGVALQMQRDLPGAARAYQRALALRPDLDAAEFNLGVVFDQQGHSEAAITAFGNVLSRAPANVAAYKALGESLLAAGRVDAWAANFERFDEHCHDHLSAAVQALEVCAYRGDYRQLDRVLDALRNGRYTTGTPDEILDALQQLVFLLHFFDVEPELIGRYERTHAELARRVYGEPWPRATPRRPGKLRIGYLSADFRNHVMGKMMWEAVRHHDHERFEPFGYAATDAYDVWTDRFRSGFAHFDTVASLSDNDAARRIALDDLDVLVDLSTHTKGARPGILARKPARVQITHVASAGTTALSAIDFKLTDRHADLEDASVSGVEALLPMEGCVYPWRRIEPAPGAAFDRNALRIPEDLTVIGAFSAPLKLSQRCLAVWREVLARIPRSVLAFSPTNSALCSTYAQLVANSGIDAGRIVFIAQGRDESENEARYRAIDFVLDPMPYGGVNGTMEALGMGVPVVTLVGRRHAERTSYSILANLGVTATVAHTGPEYVAIAERLATDAAFMREVRSRIVDGIAHSPLTDMPAHTRNLEAAYVAALAQRAPEALADAEGPKPG
jgi:tetratricopeptide (TPR) repeat protein